MHAFALNKTEGYDASKFEGFSICYFKHSVCVELNQQTFLEKENVKSG